MSEVTQRPSEVVLRRYAAMQEAFGACHSLCETCDHNQVVAPVDRPWEADAACTGTPDRCPVIKEQEA